jgi:hypothetical protein
LGKRQGRLRIWKKIIEEGNSVPTVKAGIRGFVNRMMAGSIGKGGIKFLGFIHDLLPESYINWVVVRMTEKRLSHFRTAWTACLHHPAQVNLPRFDRAQIDAVVVWARERFEKADFFVISDISRSDIPYDFKPIGARWLDDIDSAPDSDLPRVFFCLYESDEKLSRVLHSIMKLPDAYYYTPKAYLPTARYFHRDDIFRKVLLEEIPPRENWDTFDLADYENIAQALQVTRDLGGAYVEIGVYKGASAHLALNYMHQAKIVRPAYFLDLFEGFSYEAAKESADAFWLGQFSSTSLESVANRLAAFDNKHLVKCNIINDELPAEIGDIAVCNIDVDIYEAVTSALMKTADRIVPGGIILVEDQGHTPNIAGGFLAIQDFLAGPKGQLFLSWNLTSGQALLVRK